MLNTIKSLLAVASVFAFAACASADPAQDEESTREGSLTSSLEAESVALSTNPLSISSACPCGDGWYCSGNRLVHLVSAGNSCLQSQYIDCSHGCVHQACGQNDYCL